jgi:hypothetical protein
MHNNIPDWYRYHATSWKVEGLIHDKVIGSFILPYLFSPLFLILWGGTLGIAATTGLLYQPRIIGEGDCGEIGGIKIGRGNRSTRRKPTPAPLCPSQNPTWLDPGLNLGRRGGKPATNRLSYGAAFFQPFFFIWFVRLLAMRPQGHSAAGKIRSI